MLIVPLRFQNIETRSRLVYSLERELTDEFFDRKHFLGSAGIPPEKCKKVDEGFREITRLLVSDGCFLRFRILPCQGKDRKTETVSVAFAQLAVAIWFQ